MTMNTNNLFSSRIMAAICALVLSTTMVLSSVGPAFNAEPSKTSQGNIA